ncbi:MAG TPA: GAF domain-containing sensor histidine kinase [Dongiaceae bacterium]|nr:GAF domain-containing sensor histidine kinase [Dongiaceae bacterium]
MLVAPCVENEEERLRALARYGVMDSAPEADFDAVTQLLAFICDTPITLVSLVDRDRQWFKSKVGLDGTETSRDVAFCAHAILQSDLFIVEDATRDPRFADNPFVLSDPHVRFYAGAPLITRDGFALGTLCAIDNKPRKLSPTQEHAINTLARHVVAMLELRLKLRETEQLNRELAQTQQELQDNIAYRSRFFATVNHEMRTPLNAIAGFAQRLQKRILVDTVPGYVREGLDLIGSAAHRLVDLVNDVLDMSKIEVGKMTVQEQPFSPAVLLREVCDTLQVVAEEKGVHLQLQLDPALQSHYMGDSKKIGQIALNLVSNAVKFTPANKAVFVRCEPVETGLRLQIQDEGLGIAAEDQPKVFLPFEQFHIATPQDSKGTGLGLSIVKSLVELMHGSIALQSEFGKGTCFTLILPMRVAPSLPASE